MKNASFRRGLVSDAKDWYLGSEDILTTETHCNAIPVIFWPLSAFMHIMYALIEIKTVKHYHNCLMFSF